MKLTAELKEQIKAIAEENHPYYSVIAIRVQEVPFEMGSIDHVSHIWDDGEDTGEELPGVSGIMVSLMQCAQGEYPGDHIAVIGGRCYEAGEDAGEVIIEDAEVIAILA